MSPVDTTNNTNNTININLDATLGISDTEAANLVSTLKTNLVGKEGITDISYVNGGLAVEYEGGMDTLAAKLQGLVFSSDEMKAFLGEDVKDVAFKKNLDETITLTTNGVSETKKMSDFDIRELMKLLIAAFSEIQTADRERALNVLNATVTALESKISAMETQKEEQFRAAMSQAIGSIVSGCVGTVMAVGGGICSGVGLAKSHSSTSGFTLTGKSMNQQQIDKTKRASEHLANAGQTLGNMSMPLGKIIEGSAGVDAAVHGLAKSEADIEATKADALLEILRTAQEQYKKGSDSLQQFIDKILNIMQQLLQSASQTEKAVANI